MTPELEFIPFRSPTDKGWAEAYTLYHNSFPCIEIRSDAEHLRALRDSRFEADGIWHGEQFIGILYYWKHNDWCYVEHLAISPLLRGQNMGSVALAAFCRKMGRVILEIDPPVDDISVRRLHFYERLGFVANPHEYLHPSFSKPFQTHKLVLMSYPTPLEEDETRSFADFVREVVLHYSEHVAPTLPRLP